MDQILEKDKSIKSKAKFQILPKHSVCPSTMHIMAIKILHILHIQSDVLQGILDSLS